MSARSIRRAPERQLKSRGTGTITPEGKATSSQDSVRHGCCSGSVRLLKDESMID